MPAEDVSTETTTCWHLSDGFLGALIVLLTVATALSAGTVRGYRSRIINR